MLMLLPPSCNQRFVRSFRAQHAEGRGRRKPTLVVAVVPFASCEMARPYVRAQALPRVARASRDAHSFSPLLRAHTVFLGVG